MAVERGACNGTPVNWLTPMEHRVPKMQSMLTKQAAEKQRNEVLALLSEDDACDFQSNGGTGAGAFLQPTPQDSTCTPMPDAHFRTSLCDRLLLPVCPPNSTCQHRKAMLATMTSGIGLPAHGACAPTSVSSPSSSFHNGTPSTAQATPSKPGSTLPPPTLRLATPCTSMCVCLDCPQH